MNMDLDKACQTLLAGGYTCVVCKGGNTHTATLRGVKPLLSWLDAGLDLRGYSAADKVVGKATAWLYCLLGVQAVYAQVMSKPAAQVLRESGISASWETLVEGIVNRRGDGPCPFEDAVMGCRTSQEALDAIREKAARMGL